MENQDYRSSFVYRHIGPDEKEKDMMLKTIGVNSVEELINNTVPEKIKIKTGLKLRAPLTESQFLKKLKGIAGKNDIYKSYIGMGYYDTITPPVIQRNILENPGWYTQYTPYQAEISQGRLEALLNFQTVIVELTGLNIANASLLDEATAAAEVMNMFYASRKNKHANKFFVSDGCFPQTIDVLKTRSAPHMIELVVGDATDFSADESYFGMLLQYPSLSGGIKDYSDIIADAKSKGVYSVIAADLLALTMLKTPADMGADAAVGSTQRFGVPMGFGGPHAAYLAARDEFKRTIPGRIIGISVDADGNRAYRMALQTREQHIRREKATSNICTSQVLLAIMAGMYAVYHGPEGLKAIAGRIMKYTGALASGLKKLSYELINENYFDTLCISFKDGDVLKDKIREIALRERINLNYFLDNRILIAIDETTELSDVQRLLDVFAEAIGTGKIELEVPESEINSALIRTSGFLNQKVFNSYHSEMEMTRYIKNLEKKDLSLTGSMIPLGSCTMKLNATVEMFGISWPEFSSLHPFVPAEQAAGYNELIGELEEALCEITGFSGVSLQPNSGAQGEYSGLMVIRQYHLDHGNAQRNVVLIPSSAHGTNPASAVMAGMNVVLVECDESGNISLADLRAKAEMHKDNLAALMVTYPSTHGVFEEDIKEICSAVHNAGGLVYMDGANMNAQVGLTSPREIGADVCHLNLHKTFAIPHGGGGPGVGPIAVSEKLKEYLPGHSVVNTGSEKSISAVSAAPYGSANVLIISYAYIMLMGAEGLKKATEYAILNANYLKARLEKHYPVLYTGSKGCVGHELIFDVRALKQSSGVDVEDIAKRLMDYGFHAPTVSFPVHGTLMVEPTESESKYELDRFCESMILIRQEIRDIEEGKLSRDDNPLKNSPHTALSVTSDEWQHTYTRKQAAYPAEWTIENKFWPAVARINNAYGDRNLVCTCEPVESYR